MDFDRLYETLTGRDRKPSRPVVEPLTPEARRRIYELELRLRMKTRQTNKDL